MEFVPSVRPSMSAVLSRALLTRTLSQPKSDAEGGDKKKLTCVAFNFTSFLSFFIFHLRICHLSESPPCALASNHHSPPPSIPSQQGESHRVHEPEVLRERHFRALARGGAPYLLNTRHHIGLLTLSHRTDRRQGRRAHPAHHLALRRNTSQVRAVRRVMSVRSIPRPPLITQHIVLQESHASDWPLPNLRRSGSALSLSPSLSPLF